MTESSRPSSPSRGAGAQRIVFLSVSGALALALLVAARSVLLPFVLALVIAYVLAPLASWVEKRGVKRALAIIIVYVVVLGTLGGAIQLGAPRVGQELANLRRELPTLAARLRNEWVPALQERLRAAGVMPPPQLAPERLSAAAPAIVARPQPDGSFAVEIGSGLVLAPGKHGTWVVEPLRDEKDEPFDPDRVIGDAVGRSFAYAQNNALELARIGRTILAGVSRAVFVFGITLMLAAYLMLTREKILAFFASLVRPRRVPSFERLLARIDRGLSGVVRGQLIICIVNGVLSAVGFAIVGLKYWPVMALLATVLSLIPIFGAIFSAVPAVALGLTQSFGTAVFVLVWIVGIHQLEANFLNPKIMGDAAKIHPVLVIFSLLVGEHYFQVVGALLAVPCMSVAQSLFLHFRQVVHEGDPELAAQLPPDSVAQVQLRDDEQ
jgi:predicted PurR-regulated permease PerM